ncbi:MAG: HAD family phosphatase [Candidatus Daviesbacteria bacterium]|nr:HAD family phosphatase [Candidatus Daviesbacteria bacterium]
MIKAVIFDMDGVISDTLPIHGEAESKLLLRYGIQMTPQQIIQEFNGVPDRISFKIIFKRFNRKLNLQEVEDGKWELFQELAKNGIKSIPNSLKFIDILLENKFVLGLASSAPSRIINLVLETLEIKKKFKEVVCTEEVEHGKPAPDIFLLAAKKLEIDPQDCIVIEDAPRGIQAAKAAGMKCIAITTTHPRGELIGADKIIDSFDEINITEIQNL